MHEKRAKTGTARQLLALLGVACCAACASAEVRLPKMLSDHAVLQRRAPIHIWGWADPGERVDLRFHAQSLTATADALGKWSAWLRPEEAGGPYTLTVAGTNTLTLTDLLVGDVWFASGQSNMEFPLNGFPGSAVMKNGPEEIAKAERPGLRLLVMDRKSSDYPLEDQGASWTLCTPETAARFSAVAYLFGRELHEREHVPIGLIDSTWGGTPVAAWVSSESLGEDASLMPVYSARAAQMQAQADLSAQKAKEQREDAAAKVAGQPPPQHSWHPDASSWAPGGLYNGMVAPAAGYTIKGVIWYQGESDSMTARAPLYEKTFTTLITDWRARWKEGDFPFLYAQISSFTSTPVEHWGTLREAQRRTLKLANTAMAVTLDVGDPNNVHPSDKQTVAARLALAARATVYGEKVEFSGPTYRQATPEGGAIRVWFDHAAGLRRRSVEFSGRAGSALGDFEVAGSDHIFHRADAARMDGETVVVSAKEVEQPLYVRYAWPNAPAVYLENGAGLPASTFTSEESLTLECVPAFPGGCVR